MYELKPKSPASKISILSVRANISSLGLKLFLNCFPDNWFKINSISVLSDFEFNTTTGVYEPKEQALNELVNVEYSAYLPVDNTTPLVQLVATLPGSPTMTPDANLINIVGVEFYQEVNSNYYIFNQGNAMKIVDIF